MTQKRTSRFIPVLGACMVFFLVLASSGCQFGGGGGAPGGTPAALDGNQSIWYVAPNGNDQVNTCHTASSPCATIQFAIDNAYNGATVHIAPGTYIEHLDINNKGIRLDGAGIGTFLTWLAEDDLGGVIHIECPGCYTLVSISGLTIQDGDAEKGGGIYASDAELTLKNVIFYNNYAKDGGGLYISANSTAKLTNVTFNANQAKTDGGGVFNEGDLTMDGCEFDGNTAGGDGGGLNTIGQAQVNTSRFVNNTTIGMGGGIQAYTLDHPVDNQMYMSGSAKFILRDSTLTGNQALIGGGLANNGMSTDIANSTFNENIAGSAGGGLSNMNYGLVVIDNVTFSANTAAFGGGIANGSPSGNLIAASLTLAGNHASSEGGGLHMGPGSHNFINTIFSYNTPNNCTAGPLTGGIIMSTDASCGFTGAYNIKNVDPLLGPLQDNGGATWTHALLGGSPAIDSGTNWLCPTTDQRGVKRGLDGNADGVSQDDIGAYEVSSIVMSGSVPGTVVTTTPGPGNFTFIEPGNCRSGPDTVYPVVASAAPGTLAPVDGRNDNLSWYRIQLSNSLCWVGASIGTFDGDPFALEVRETPPLPELIITDTPSPTCSIQTTQTACAAIPACKWVEPLSTAPFCTGR